MTPSTTETWLTGITTTGTPHIGNYVGAIRPGIASSRTPGRSSYYFLADLHALVKSEDPDKIQRSTREIAAAWLALGLDPERTVFYHPRDPGADLGAVEPDGQGAYEPGACVQGGRGGQ